MKNIYINLLSKLGKNIPLALATIIETKGSTPQVQGASAIFSLEGLIKGTLGGGILEADALKKALNAIQKKVSQLYEFDLHADISSDEGAICGGKAVILIDTCLEKNMNIFSDIEKSLGRYQPGVLATFIGRYKDEKISIARHWVEKNKISGPGLKAKLSRYRKEIKKCLDENNTLYLEIEKKSYFENAPETFLFLEPLFPLPALIIAGAGHIGQAVSHLGSLLEFEVTVIDDRPEYSNREKIPDADHLIVDDIEKAIRKIPKTSDTSIVIVTRGHKNDADALRQCIDSESAYIGMIGSKQKIRLMREKFLEEGWATPSQFDRVHAPIGIEIQSKTVQEIAVSICAQLILARHQKQKGKNKSIICAIILAAGESRRMGKPKLLLPYGDGTIIETVIGQTVRSKADNVLVVLGSDKEKISMQIRNYPVEISENPEFRSGMLSSIQCGFKTLPENTHAALVLLGDQPMIPSSVIDKIIDAYRQSEKGIVIAVYNGKRGHPILFEMKYRSEVEQLISGSSLRDLTHKHSEDILEVEVDAPGILRDIDTMNDYNKELKYRRLS